MNTRVTSRRRALQGVFAAGACAAIGPNTSLAGEAASLPLITRPIPTTGERLPVVGIGTNAYDVSAAGDYAARREVLAAMPGLGVSVVDTARGYGASEKVIGRILAELGTRERFFLATKPISAPQADAVLSTDLLDASFTDLGVSRIDLLQVHSLVRLDDLLPRYKEYKQAGRVRYIGVTTAASSQYPQLLAVMRAHRLDFIQVNYSIDDRTAADEILPLAMELGVAVLNNVPLGGRNGSLFPRVAEKALPSWAGEFDAHSWAQFMLKYNLSHPAITAVIPGTTTLEHLRDNQQAGRGRLPDAPMRRRMEQFWSTI